ncbi:MAG: PEP-CTERM sorting domain-containing protein, partial [Methyloprofundus sp.]|nr:PEP-CTERM sorting domain-containing protein [Methyloprofundus sp.]
QTPAEARAAWEAELASFGIDDLNGSFGSTPFTSTFGNTYSLSGNGSIITSTGSGIQGNRNGASLIQFDVDFTAPVNAVGFDVFDNDGGGMTLALTDSISGAITTFNFNSVSGSNLTEFFGVVFDPTVFIASLLVGGTDPGGITTWDNFTTGVGQNAVVQAPEPSTLAILALGVIGVASRRLKK